MVKIALPSGIVTFLYTDIEGSTLLWDTMPDAMRMSLEMHNTILNESITAHGGKVYKVIGDAFQAAFVKPAQAVEAAVAAQRALNKATWGDTGPIRVRMGIHTGDAESQGDDYTTTHTLNRVARVMSAAHGGQILISQAVADLTQGALPPGMTLRDMGQHRLKGLRQLEHLYQVVLEDLPQDFPPLATLEDTPSNLPLQPTSFVGRQGEMAEIKQLLSSTRLLTLTGPGGVGKTRLALKLAEDVLEEYPNGVWFVELAHLPDPSLVPQAVAASIGLREQEGSQITDLLVSYVKGKKILLILDNCEHLIEACAETAQLILSASPTGTVLATSRQNLGLSGEQVFPLTGMDLPENAQATGAANYPAIQLLVQSARRVATDFELKQDELESVIHICHLVQGMPLGILLAAGWVDLLTLDEIASEITTSIDFLETELRDVPERHRSLRAAFEYSWGLLADEERTALASLSVFRGGFTRQAAQIVADVSLRSLNILSRKSLLQRDSGSPRYFIHGQIRQFAEGKLEAAGNTENIRESHSRYYLSYLSESAADLKGGRQLDALDEIEADFENIRTAWSWAVVHKAEGALDKALENLYLFTLFRSHFSEGYELFQQARVQFPAQDETASPVSGRLLIRYIDPNQDPSQVYSLGLKIARQYGQPTDIAYALNQLGAYLAHTEADFSRGMSLLEESLRIYRASGDDYAMAKVLDDIAFGYSLTDQSQRLFYGQESLAIRRRIGDWIGVANVLRNLSIAAVWSGKPMESIQYMEEALSIAHQMGDLNSAGWIYSLLAEAKLLMGDFKGGQKLLNDGYRISLEIHDQDLTRNCLIVQSFFATVIEEDYAKAKQLLLDADLYDLQNHMLWWSWEVYALVASSSGDTQEALQAIRFVLRRMKNGGLSLNAWPFLVVAIALTSVQLGKPVVAAECIGYFDTIPFETNKWGDNWPPLKRLRDDLGNQLDREAFKVAKQRGRNLTIERLETFLATG